MTNGPMTMTINQPQESGLIRAGETSRSDFMTSERRKSAELAAISQAAVAEASIKARYSMALHRPSSFLEVRSKILADCERAKFAEVAWYAKPVGGSKVEGPSIRFAEAFMRARGNMAPAISIIHDDPERRIIMAELTDFESNVVLSRSIVMEKIVDRSNADGREVLSVRKNSGGGTTYSVRAREDELVDKEASLVSKALRGLIIRLCPGDLLEEAKKNVFLTRKKGAAADPNGVWLELVDNFEMQLRIKPAMLAEYLGHSPDSATPDEILDLQLVYTAIRDGDSRWSDHTAHKRGAVEPQAPTANAVRAAIIQSAPAKAPAPVANTPPAVDVLAEARAATPAQAAPQPAQAPPPAQATPAPPPAADAPKAPPTDPAAEAARAQWMAESDALIAEYAALTPKPGESPADATDRAMKRLGTRKGKVTPASRMKWLEEARAVLAELRPPPATTAAQPRTLAVVPPQTETPAEPGYDPVAFKASVQWHRERVAELIRGDLEDQESAFSRAVDRLGPATLAGAAAWLDNAGLLLAGLEEPK